ncbi:plasminogen isoform X1 [Rhincodon typus]|uniref:plasminogen isoform X1 n=1 Tax=Rhincodon typus TaxID=259920 RepID=UPI00202E000D|nr:plasminogen isoform X1 [Rhincodon typus]
MGRLQTFLFRCIRWKCATLSGCFRSVRSNILTEYVKTEGAWIHSVRESKYPAISVKKCAEKCNTESQFLCRAFLFTQKNQECIITADNSHTQLLVRKPNVILYEKQAFLLECKSGNGAKYRGTATKTISGRTCQRWDSNTPHKPKYTPENSPHADLEENYCRNPDNDSTGPWCYTQDVNKRWEYCQIQNCEEECMICSGEDYRGKISQTVDGVTCQHWNSQTPHLHGYNPSIFPDKYLEENYCRNPDGEPRPWCFTTDIQKRWAFCNVPRCDKEPPAIEEETDCYTGKGQKYRGTERTTISGRICQRWDAQKPHLHSRTPANYPCKGLEQNYCRNPDNEKEPWCYTTDPDTRWEYCQVRKCGLQPTVPTQEGGPTDCFTENGYDYRGTTSVTVSGKRCQGWDSMTPHSHEKTSRNFPEAGLVDNYCRNPDNDRAPWCYTTDPSVRWEYCRISKCQAEQPQSPTVVPSQAPGIQTDCQVGIGETYRGTRSTTSSGRTCQNWSAMTPHQHNSFTPVTHPNAGLDGNYCRNPDGDLNGPWCFTTDPRKQFDYCDDIPICGQQTNECGISNVEPKKCFGRIVGGCVSKPHSWPWQVSLRTYFGAHFCGGTLIDVNWVLTAKHCVERNLRASYYKVYIGIHREAATESSRQIIDIDKIFLEPKSNDIALLKLRRPAILSDKVALICLPKKGYILPSGAECYVTGWGETQGTGGNGILKEAGFPVIENKVCNRPEYLNGRVSHSELCAGNIEGAMDSCQGDSGGPLVCPNTKGKYILQGVTSWGLGCARRMKPGVYVRVSHFIDWIQSIIRDG